MMWQQRTTGAQARAFALRGARHTDPPPSPPRTFRPLPPGPQLASGQLDRIFLAGSLPHEFIISIVTSFTCLWLINFSLSLSLSLSLGSNYSQTSPSGPLKWITRSSTNTENLVQIGPADVEMTDPTEIVNE